MMMNRTDMTRYIAERLGNLATNDDAERLYQFLRAADKIRATEAGELEIDGDIRLLYTSPSPRDGHLARMPASARQKKKKTTNTTTKEKTTPQKQPHQKNNS